MKCPICGSEATDKGSRDYGDKSRYECPRCGPYEISRTALTMLEGRLGDSPTARARLSHVLRMGPKKDGEWFMVTSANIDELVSQPLPDVDKQLMHLLEWLAVQVGDDRLGHITLPDVTLNELTGIVGVVDWERLGRLIEHATDEELVDAPHTRKLGFTPKGWKMLKGVSEKDEATTPPKSEKADANRHDENTIVTANCNKCDGERKSFQRCVFSAPGSDGVVSWSDTMEILECCGCGGLSMRHKFWFSEWDQVEYHPISGDPMMRYGVKTTSWPPASSRKKPDWVDELKDSGLRKVLDEVYTALDHDQTVLAAIGTRTLLDMAMLIRVGDVDGGFPGKLHAMAEGGRIGREEKEIFRAMVDVGSAAAHRGFTPGMQTLNKVLTATESLLHREFILPADAEAVREATPARAKRARKKGAKKVRKKGEKK